MWAWGWNIYGQLGDGTNISKTTPVQIGTDNDWASVSENGLHRLALKSNGTLWAWGWNIHGQLGDGTTVSKNSPVQIGLDNNWQSVSTGRGHSLAIKSDGTLWAWGDNDWYGQLGDGTTVKRSSPVQIGTDNNWRFVSAGHFQSSAIKSDGTLWIWGYVYGMSNKQSPFQVGIENNWQSVSAGSYFIAARKVNGSLWAWGDNSNGQLGDGTTVFKASPVQVGSVGINWALLSAGSNHTTGIKSDGTLWTWGNNTNGQLGDGTLVKKTSPIQIGTDNNWVSVSAGDSHTLALKSDGTLWAWGYNGSARLGDGTWNNKISPIQIGTGNNWVSVSAYGAHTAGMKSDGTLWTWGWNAFGQLGDGTTVWRLSPIQVGTDKNWISVTVGGSYTVALKSDGTLWAWGNNPDGRLGDGTMVNKIAPVKIGVDNNWTSFSVGGDYSVGGGHTVALKSDGTLWAWGYNLNGQLGDGTTVNKTSPTQIGVDNNWGSVSAGKRHTLARKSDGSLWGWGYNWRGQLGDGTTGTKHSPVQIGSPDIGLVLISAGADHTSGIKSDGSLWSWGYNLYGQLGDGTISTRYSPVQVGVYTLTIYKSGNGTITSSPPPDGGSMSCNASTCTGSYASGTVVTLNAYPDAGYGFSHWSGQGCLGSGSCTITMNSNKGLWAYYQQCSYSFYGWGWFGSEGGIGSANVWAPNGCGWTAQANDPWITIDYASSGSGNGYIVYSVDANLGTGTARQGSIIAGGQTVSFTQDGAFSGELEVELSCPTSVATGRPLIVDVTLSNQNCNTDITVNRFTTGYIANSAGTLEGLDIGGLFPKQWAALSKTVPGATCDQSGVTPGTIPTFSMKIIHPVPVSLAGTGIGATVGLISNTGEWLGGGDCAAGVK